MYACAPCARDALAAQGAATWLPRCITYSLSVDRLIYRWEVLQALRCNLHVARSLALAPMAWRGACLLIQACADAYANGRYIACFHVFVWPRGARPCLHIKVYCLSIGS